MRLNLQRWLCVLVLWLVSGASIAHQTGNSYLYIRQTDGKLAVDLDFYVRDLGNLLQRPDASSAPAPEQIQALQAAITDVIQRSLKIDVDEQPAALEFIRQSVVLHNDGLYVRQQFSGPTVAADARFMVIRYEFFTQNDKLGRAFLKLAVNGDEISSVFDQSNPVQRFALGDTKRSATILLFTKEGAKHIWGGADHLLFLLTLLLPGLLLLKVREGQPEGSLPSARASREAEIFALKVITAFTVAHSITLAMASFGLITLPEKLVESLIAFSIIASAVMNLQQRYQFNHWQLAFLFGLIHGMGFANGLKELGLSSTYFLETLVAFNVGVELGQLSTLLVVAIPLVLLVRPREGRQRVLKWGSLAVLAVSAGWLVQRLMA